MKIRFYLALAAAALVMTNCSKEEEPVQEKQQSKGFTATIEGASRSAVTDAGVFSWTAGDKISVWNGLSFDTYANSDSDVNTFNPEGDADIAEAKDYAVYPASAEHNFEDGTLLVNLPASYAHGSTNAPMLATIEDGSTTLAFRHLAGVMRFVVKNVPAGASSFVFTTTNNIITGSYSVIEEQIWQDGENSVNNNNSVTITFDALTEAAAEMVFYVPLPVGTYGNYTVAINGTNVNLSHQSTGVTNTIGRRTLLLMPEFFVENGELKKGEGNVIPVTQEEVALSGNQSVTISATGADTEDVLSINYTPSEGNATLNITDGSGEDESQESVAKIKINPQGEIESLNLNTPTLTAELGAGTYKKVEALTANQTLIIGEDVTIEELVLNGGALEIAEGATTSTIENIVVKDETGLRSAVAVGGKVTLQDDITLTGYDQCLWIKKDCEIDLGEYDINHSQSTVIKIAAGGKLTIGGNGTVETTDAACGAIANLGGTLIINGGTYKSIGAGTIYCDRGEGATWNLTINGGEFIATNSTAVSLQNNRIVEGEESITADGLAAINGGIFTAASGWHDLYLANVIADIDTEKCTFTNNKVYLLTAGPAIDGGNGTWGSVINDVAYEPGEVGNGYISNF